MQDDAGMAKATKFKDTVNRDEDGMMQGCSLGWWVGWQNEKKHQRKKNTQKTTIIPVTGMMAAEHWDDEVSIIPIIPVSWTGLKL